MKRNGTIERTATQTKTGLTVPRLLTIKKAAEFLGLTDWAMRSRVWSGDIPVVRFPCGRKMYFDKRARNQGIVKTASVFQVQYIEEDSWKIFVQPQLRENYS
jgi:hypothetical protein